MMVTISATEYEGLRRDSLLLTCLNNAGVDNWDGYDYAMEEFKTISSNEDTDSSDEWGDTP